MSLVHSSGDNTCVTRITFLKWVCGKKPYSEFYLRQYLNRSDSCMSTTLFHSVYNFFCSPLGTASSSPHSGGGLGVAPTVTASCSHPRPFPGFPTKLVRLTTRPSVRVESQPIPQLHTLRHQPSCLVVSTPRADPTPERALVVAHCHHCCPGKRRRRRLPTSRLAIASSTQ